MYRRSVACPVILALTISCRQIVDFDDHATDVSFETAPRLPFVPESDYAERCEVCARERCDDLRDRCVADEVCKALLRCHGACSNAACRAQCGSFDYRDDSDNFTGASTQGSESPLLTAYIGCVGTTECPRECNTGRNWTCIEDRSYRWPNDAESTAPEVPLRLELVGLVSEQGVPASVTALWGDQVGPGNVADRGETDEWGQTQLDFEESFIGLIEVESDQRGVIRNLVHAQPIFRPTRWATLVIPATVLEMEPGRASIWVSIKDCLGFDAPGVSLELSQNAGVQTFYYGADVGLSFDASETGEYGSGGFVDVPLDRKSYTILARREEAVVARRSVFVRPDWTTIVHLEPREAE
jgi:hypothetical protein